MWTTGGVLIPTSFFAALIISDQEDKKKRASEVAVDTKRLNLLDVDDSVDRKIACGRGGLNLCGLFLSSCEMISSFTLMDDRRGKLPL